MSAPKSEWPGWWGAATSRFSSTVRRPNSAGRWNVRPRPGRARAYAGTRVMSSPSRRTVPLLAGRVPATTAMKVDLPAPFGPMRPVIWPLGTSSDTPSTACIPSKCRWTSSATSIGRSGCADTIHQLHVGASFEYAPRLWPHSLGPEPDEPENAEADHDPLDRRDHVGRPDVQPDHQQS